MISIIRIKYFRRRYSLMEEHLIPNQVDLGPNPSSDDEHISITVIA